MNVLKMFVQKSAHKSAQYQQKKAKTISMYA